MARCKFLQPQLLDHQDLTLARHDPEAEGAIVMKATTPEHAQKFNKKCAFALLILEQNSGIIVGTCPPWQ
jgi:hypothetical protein